MSDPNDANQRAKTARKPVGDHMTLTAFEIAEGAEWIQQCQVATMPAPWLALLREEYRKQPGVRDGWSLPTRGLVEILIGVDPAIIHVDWNPESDTFIVAFDGADTSVLTAAIAAWATTEISGEVDWFTLLNPADLRFTSQRFNILEHGQRTNGTAAVAPHVFKMLPTFIAKHVVDHGLTLLDTPRKLILGPPQRNNRRDIVLWPPVRLHSDDAGEALVTAKITIHIETVPNHPRPHVHADLSISRFPLMPVTYVPARGDGPAGGTLWLHAPDGFLRPHEPHTLLSAPIRQAWSREKGTQWKWKPGLARALAKLTHLPFPAPDKVLAQPATAADEGAIRAYFLYSEGTKSQPADIDEPDGGSPDGSGSRRKSKSLLHAAKTGFVPGDHIEVHRQLGTLLAPLGIVPTRNNGRVGSKAARKIKMRFDPADTYTIELWTHTETTRNAVLATLRHHFELTRTDDGADSTEAHFTGDLNLTVLFRDGTDLAAGISRRSDDKRPESTVRGAYANHVLRELGVCTDRHAAVLELDDDRHFSRIGRIDPKPALKKAFGRSRRPLQCLRPAALFKPPKTWPEKSKRKPPAPYPGTEFGTSTILRCAAAVNDALRQLGRLGSYTIPATLPDMEHIGIWLHHDGKTCIPLVVRHSGDAEPTAVLAAADGTAGEIPYRDLPYALASGRGRIGPGPQQKALIATFLTNVLGIGAAPDVHNRVAFVRAGSFRNWGWDWLQDKHLTPDDLIGPGVELDENGRPAPLGQADCPGLRVIRVRDRSSNMEVARGFASDTDTYAERISGLFRFTERVYYAINPRSDQMQLPLTVTKLDPDLHRNFTATAANPVPLELCVAFRQPGDDPETLATLAAQLRRAHAHTVQDTRYPGVLHLCSLAAEYL